MYKFNRDGVIIVVGTSMADERRDEADIRYRMMRDALDVNFRLCRSM